LSNNVLTLDFDTTSYADTDKLYICINDKPKQDARIDAFGRQRVSEPQSVFEGQLTYGLQPLLYEQITSGTGASISHDSTNRCASLAFSSTASTGSSIMQTFEHFRYQAGKSQLIYISFNMIESATGVTKFAGYSDGANGIEFITSGGTNSLRLLSDTAEGDTTIAQSNWNLNTYTDLDISKVQLMVIDFQALYVGVVRVGFEIEDRVIYVHQFAHVNSDTNPYIQTANLPVRVGMTVDSGTRTTSMKYICTSISSEGGLAIPNGVPVAQHGGVSAGNGSRTHLLSLRPKTTFNGITNRVKFAFVEVSLTVTGNSPVLWELCIGQAISGTTTYSDVNTTYSAMQYNTAGTISGSPALVIDKDVIAATNQQKANVTKTIDIKVPISLDAAGAVRANGTLSLVVTGQGGNSFTYGTIKWIEIY